MAKRNTSKRTTKSNNADRRDGATYEKIDTDMIGRGKTATVKVLEHVATTNSDYGTSELLRVSWRGEKYSLFVRHGSGNYRRMVKRFGENAKRWEGSSIDLTVKSFEATDGRNVDYVAIV